MTLACPDCGTLQTIPPLPPRGLAVCRACGLRLERTSGRSVDAALACAIATLVLLAAANVFPMLRVTLAGAVRQSVMGSGVVVLWRQGWAVLAVLIGAFVVVFPLVRFGLLAAALGALKLGRRPGWLGPVFRLSLDLGQWAMSDVFLIGCVVGYSRVVPFLPIRIEAGGWCVVAAAFLAMITDASLDARSVWRAIAPETSAAPGQATVSCTVCDLVQPFEREGGRCPRCRARLWARKPDALVRTLALVAAGLLLYGPANVYSMTNTLRPDGVHRHTIFSGIMALIHAHLWPLAVLIFCTSIAIPMLKLVGLTWLVVSVRRRSGRWRVGRTRLHRLIDRIGRWSCVDVFTLAVFAPVMQFGSLVQVRAAPGSVAFILVVVLTMIASATFDPRLIWDAAEAADAGRR